MIWFVLAKICLVDFSLSWFHNCLFHLICSLIVTLTVWGIMFDVDSVTFLSQNKILEDKMMSTDD